MFCGAVKNHPSTNPWQERFAIKQMIENKERKRRSQMTNQGRSTGKRDTHQGGKQVEFTVLKDFEVCIRGNFLTFFSSCKFQIF